MATLPYAVSGHDGIGRWCAVLPNLICHAVFRHRLGIAVMVGCQPFTAHEVIGTQADGVSFLAEGVFVIRLPFVCLFFGKLM